MATETITEPAATVQLRASEGIPDAPRLDDRFATLKQEIMRDVDPELLRDSYKRLKKELAAEADRLASLQQDAIPEVDWSEVKANGGKIPSHVASAAHQAGCILFRGVISEEQALSWKAELKDYTARHGAVGGRPLSNPTFWLLYWTRPQIQARSHPEILSAMSSVMKLWHIEDSSLPIDISAQIHYADRFRIRRAGDKEYSLKPHLDSSAIERWEDPKYRSNYEAILRGDWENFDPWCMDNRPDAVTDLYQAQGSCSAFRAMQGWLSMSNCGPGEGTLRLLPSLKLAMAYIMLRPFFNYDDEDFDSSQASFPGATPGGGQFFPTERFHPHLQLKKSMISVPKVKPGDYMFWHCDIVHEVEDSHNGSEDSSVFYNASIPLCSYNIENMLRMRQDFRDVVPPRDFLRDCGGPYELEKEHEDHGAREENILSDEGRRALGLEDFDEAEEGLTEGQRLVRRMANDAMRE